MKINEKTSFKLLIITDNHNRIFNSRKIVDLFRKSKFDYVFCCGDVVTVPIDKNNDRNSLDLYIPLLTNIFLELEKIAPIIWVPGNHEPYIYFEDYYQEPTSKSTNLHKKVFKLDENLYIVGFGGSCPILSGGQWNKSFNPFEKIDFKNFKYTGFPYNVTPNDYLKSDELLRKDLEETVAKAKKEGGENVQMIFLTHLGPVYTCSNCMEEGRETLYLGSKALGEIFEREKNAFIDVHGHTHPGDSFITLDNNKYVFNPGANFDGHYGTLEIVKNKEGIWRVKSYTMDYLDV